MCGEIEEDTKKINIEFVEIDKKEFVEEEIDISDKNSEEELIEYLNNMDYDYNKYYKIIIIGEKRFEINTGKILRNINNENVIKIKDKTKIQIDLENLAKQNNLKGIFVKNLLDKLQENPEEKEKILRAIEIGLALF